jgi:hypothetical protein
LKGGQFIVTPSDVMQRATQVGLLLALTLGVMAACGPAQDAKPDQPSSPLIGVWAWRSGMNCYYRENTISFEEDRIEVHLHDKLELTIDNPNIRRSVEEGLPTFHVRYSLANRTYEEDYVLIDPNTLRVKSSTLDGEPRPNNVVGVTMVRCLPDMLSGDDGPPLSTPLPSPPLDETDG